MCLVAEEVIDGRVLNYKELAGMVFCEPAGEDLNLRIYRFEYILQNSINLN